MATEAFSDEMLGAILGGQNPWWRHGSEAAPHAGAQGHVRRDLDEAVGGVGDRHRIHAIVGPRQAGKTSMLLQLAARIMGDGCDPRRIMYASLAEPPLSLGAGQVRRALKWYVRKVAKDAPGGAGGGRLYFLLDEVQDVDGWQGVLGRWAGPECDAKFFVSASSDMGARGCMSGPLAGRMRRQHVMPLSFSEYASLKGISAAGRAGARMRGALAKALASGDAGMLHGAAVSACANLAPHVDALRACLSEYLVYGGRPRVAMEGDQGRRMSLLADDLHLAVYGDIVRIGGVGSPARLDEILSVLAWESPRTVSASGLARELDADRGTVARCLRLLEAAHIVYGARLYSDDPGAGERAWRRVHICDPGTRTAAMRSAATAFHTDPSEAARATGSAVCDHTLRLARSYGTVEGEGRMYYWRSSGSSGDEAVVDAIVRIGGRALPVASAGRGMRIRESDLRGIRRFADRFGTRVGVIVSDSGAGMAGDGIVAIPLWLYLLTC